MIKVVLKMRIATRSIELCSFQRLKSRVCASAGFIANLDLVVFKSGVSAELGAQMGFSSWIRIAKFNAVYRVVEYITGNVLV